jgi:maltose phosphorylase
MRIVLKENREYSFDKIIHIQTSKNLEVNLEFSKSKALLGKLFYETLKINSIKWWYHQWQLSDIEINGDILNQQGIRFCIFQMNQTLHIGENSAVIGAKGLTGETYNGNTFWDSEVYCLPFYIFNNPKAAKSILMLRYDTLNQAKDRAKALDCKGAFYPIATISGLECCDLWQHANLQLQPSTAVMYGIWHYVHITKDTEFLYEYGAEMLVEICRMLASRGDYSPVSGGFGYYGVMGPDEFQMMVNNNTYTNFMAKKTFAYTMEVLSNMKDERLVLYEELKESLKLKDEELTRWQHMFDHMSIRYDKMSEIYEQHEGYFDLPEIDLKSIPVEEFPLYSHWSYDRIYRNNMIKQPDVLMFMLMYNQEFSISQIEKNFDYYEPRCVHESSLSPSVHSILSAQLGREEQAYDFFGFATRMDLDNYNRNTYEGLHTTSIAGSWMNIVYGFAGLRSDGDILLLNPILPNKWESYKFHLQINQVILDVVVDIKRVALSTRGNSVTMVVYGKEHVIKEEVIYIAYKPQI